MCSRPIRNQNNLLKRKLFSIKENRAKLLKKDFSREVLRVDLGTKNWENNSESSTSWISRSTSKKQLPGAITLGGKLIRIKSLTPKRGEGSRDSRSSLRKKLRNFALRKELQERLLIRRLILKMARSMLQRSLLMSQQDKRRFLRTSKLGFQLEESLTFKGI